MEKARRRQLSQLKQFREENTVPSELKERDEEKEFVISFNLNRRHLTMIQKVELGITIHKIEMEKAKGRQSFHGGTAPGKHKTLPSNLKEVNEEPGEATEIAAKKVGLGKDTL